MHIVQKLQIIQQLTGLTQVKLAQKLGVSFPTVNSWINQKSVPHQSKQRLIDNLYFESTGQSVVAESPMSAKKQIILDKQKRFKNIIEFIKKRSDIYDQFVLSLTYNTNRIEGSTLTEPETAAILFDNVSLANRNIIEQMEVKNHQAALHYLFDYFTSRKKIDESLILKFHGILMNGIKQDAGTYRHHGVRIVGANIPTANHIKIPQLMNKLVRDINVLAKNLIHHCARIHSQFEKIHPFSDGNGRIGRLLVHAMLLKKNYPPAVIRQEKKRNYLKYLNKSQRKDDFEDLEEFFCDAILGGFDIIEE